MYKPIMIVSLPDQKHQKLTIPMSTFLVPAAYCNDDQVDAKTFGDENGTYVCYSDEDEEDEGDGYGEDDNYDKMTRVILIDYDYIDHSDISCGLDLDDDCWSKCSDLTIDTAFGETDCVFLLADVDPSTFICHESKDRHKVLWRSGVAEVQLTVKVSVRPADRTSKICHTTYQRRHALGESHLNSSWNTLQSCTPPRLPERKKSVGNLYE
jgi:hypothetical protein